MAVMNHTNAFLLVINHCWFGLSTAKLLPNDVYRRVEKNASGGSWNGSFKPARKAVFHNLPTKSVNTKKTTWISGWWPFAYQFRLISLSVLGGGSFFSPCHITCLFLLRLLLWENFWELKEKKKSALLSRLFAFLEEEIILEFFLIYGPPRMKCSSNKSRRRLPKMSLLCLLADTHYAVVPSIYH